MAVSRRQDGWAEGKLRKLLYFTLRWRVGGLDVNHPVQSLLPSFPLASFIQAVGAAGEVQMKRFIAELLLQLSEKLYSLLTSYNTIVMGSLHKMNHRLLALIS